jgi:type II secretory pathway component PulK
MEESTSVAAPEPPLDEVGPANDSSSIQKMRPYVEAIVNGAKEATDVNDAVVAAFEACVEAISSLEDFKAVVELLPRNRECIFDSELGAT